MTSIAPFPTRIVWLSSVTNVLIRRYRRYKERACQQVSRNSRNPRHSKDRRHTRYETQWRRAKSSRIKAGT